MPALRDPKLEKFAQALASNIAAGKKRGAAADLAAETAGYKGTSRASNARKRAQRADVKVRVAELQKTASEKVATHIEVSLEWATRRLVDVLPEEGAVKADKPPDIIKTIEVLAKMHGWLAPEKMALTDPTGKHDRLAELLREIDGKTRGLPSEAHNDAVAASSVTAGSVTASGAGIAPRFPSTQESTGCAAMARAAGAGCARSAMWSAGPSRRNSILRENLSPAFAAAVVAASAYAAS